MIAVYKVKIIDLLKKFFSLTPNGYKSALFALLYFSKSVSLNLSKRDTTNVNNKPTKSDMPDMIYPAKLELKPFGHRIVHPTDRRTKTH
jgi:hypothetical protein